MAARAPALPYPRLELRWRNPTKKELVESEINAGLACDYVLVLHKRHVGDQRCNGPKGGYAARDVEVVMNTTMREGGGREPLNGEEVDTPFRDGCHAQWDADVLNIPAYAVYGKRHTKVKIRR